MAESTTGVELDRRGFLRVGSTAMLVGLGADGALAQLPGRPDFEDISWLIGPEANRPDPDGSFFHNKRGYHYVYWALNGKRFELEDGDDDWRGLPTHLVEYAAGSLPTDVVSGTILFDEDRGLPTWWDRDHYERPNFVDNQDVLITPSTVSNTTAQTEIYSIAFNPGSMIQGRVYQLDLMGTFGTANTSDQFTVIIEMGGTEIATLQNDPENASNDP